MSVHFSSINNDSLSPPQLQFMNFSTDTYVSCYTSRPNSFIIISINLFKILLILPLIIIILYHGLKEWRKMCSTFSAETMGHINTFTYHLVIMELIGVLGSALFCCGIYMEDFDIIFYGSVPINFVWYGEMFFHTLTCVERYLAVVHPFIYLSLKNERGVRIRNISSLCVWLLCLAEIGVMMTIRDFTVIIINVCLLIFFLLVISFCSLSVLCVLIRPVPGDQGEDRAMAGQSKMRMFFIILLILVLLALKLTGDVIRGILIVTGQENDCVPMICAFWLQLPNSLVLPLLFVLRTGKITCCHTK